MKKIFSIIVLFSILTSQKTYTLLFFPSSPKGHWFIEGVLEELDAPGEYHYEYEDEGEGGLLYYVYNDTEGQAPPPSLRFEAVERQRLVDVRGTQAKPVGGGGWWWVVIGW